MLDIFLGCRYLLDSLYEQERAERSVLHCDRRWTVNVNKERGKEELATPSCEEAASFGTPALLRWVTEEDLASKLPFPVEEGLSPDSGLSQPSDGLSNVHSESTDSGIQSVGDGQENGEKSCTVSSSHIGLQPELEDLLQDEEKNVQRSLIHQIFGGKMTTTYRCLDCGTESHHENFFTDLHLAFPDPTTASPQPVKNTRQSLAGRMVNDESLSLVTLLQTYFVAEKLQDDNRYHCDQCARLVMEAERTLRITEAPQHLLLTLLRFHYDKKLQRRNKITTHVDYPQRLELPVAGRNVAYFLYAVVIHSGLTLDGGHYYTLARSSRNFDANDSSRWFVFNDR